MGLIYGVLSFQNKSIDISIFEQLRKAVSYWKVNSENEYIEDSIAIGHRMVYSTPESEYDHLPLKKKSFILSMDARIDNREELARELILPDGPMEEIGDSEFVLAAYAKWGEECPKYLLGDFAFVIWDETKQQLFCARDHIGIKPFYYYNDEKQFIFCSDIRGLTACEEIPKDINDESVVNYMSYDELWHPSRTFFGHIYKLPPATTMILSNDTLSQKTYWHPENSPKIRFDTFDEYVQKLQWLLQDAVKKRIRTKKPIVSHLSGGLDSSTLAVLTARYLHKQKSVLHAFGWQHSPSGAEEASNQEWANSLEIAHKEKIDLQFIELNEDNLIEILNNHDIATDGTADLWYEYLVQNESQKIGAGTIISGWGGDECITYSGRATVTDLFYNNNPLKAIGFIWQQSKNTPSPSRSMLAGIYHKLILPSVPQSLYRYLPWVPRYDSYGTMAYYAKESFLDRVAYKQKPFYAVSSKSCRDDQINLLRQGHLQNRIESWASLAWKHKIEYVYPLLDKRIVEFALGIPPEMYNDGTIGRLLYRHAVQSILPDNIRWAKNLKLEPNRVTRYRYICKKAFSKMIARYTNDPADENQYIDISKLIQTKKVLDDNTEHPYYKKEVLMIEGVEKALLVMRSPYFATLKSKDAH